MAIQALNDEVVFFLSANTTTCTYQVSVHVSNVCSVSNVL